MGQAAPVSERHLQAPWRLAQRDFGLAAPWGLWREDRAQGSRERPCAGTGQRWQARRKRAPRNSRGAAPEALSFDEEVFETYRTLAKGGRLLAGSLRFTREAVKQVRGKRSE